MARSLRILCLAFALAISSSPSHAAEVTVLIYEYYFTPTAVTVSPGDTVTWVNRGSIPHDSTSSQGLWASPGLFPEESFSFIFTQPGDYPYVCLQHVFAFPQQTGLVVVASMNLPPSVEIANPSNGALFAPPASFTIDVDVSDADGSVVSVEFFLNGVSLSTSFGPVFSTDVAGLGAGNYSLTAVATDNQGATNTSAQVNIFVQEIPRTNFTLTKIVSPINAGKVLVTPASTVNGTYPTGTMVALAAQPRTGFHFTRWTGAVQSTNNPLLLVMNGDQSVTANFEPTEPVNLRALAGTYSGLLMDDSATNFTMASYNSSGFLRLRVSKSGAYRGTARICGTRQNVAGQFDRFGYAPLVTRNGMLSGSLQIDTAGLRMNGLLTDGKQSPLLLLYRAVPVPNLGILAGNYLLTLGVADPVEIEGSAMLRILSDGTVKMRGTLGDGTTFAKSTFISVDGTVPLFVPLYSSHGALLSQLNVATDGTVHGTASWYRPGKSRNVKYPNGFGLVIPVTGSRSN
jgi:plastocyanin